MNEALSGKEQLDEEWADLILEAIDMGMTIQEIQMFLQSEKVNA